MVSGRYKKRGQKERIPGLLKRGNEKSKMISEPLKKKATEKLVFWVFKRKVKKMVDLSISTIKKLFEEQVRELTNRTICPEDSFDLQFSGAWLR